MRCLLLVHGRVWRLGTTQTLQILSHRHPDDRRADLTHCPSIFLLPYLDLEQPHVVALSDHRHRTYHTLPFRFILTLHYYSFRCHKRLEQRGVASKFVPPNHR